MLRNIILHLMDPTVYLLSVFTKFYILLLTNSLGEILAIRKTAIIEDMLNSDLSNDHS